MADRWAQAHTARVRLLGSQRPGATRPADAVAVEGFEDLWLDSAPFAAAQIALGAPLEAQLQLYKGYERIGWLVWGKSYFWDDVTEPSILAIAEEQQRRGYATVLWRAAQAHDPALEHSEVRTEAGEAWARSTGDALPRFRFTSEEERHRFFSDHPEKLAEA